MSSKSDQVFQLSLTEIWIILCFILLLLMGYNVWELAHKNLALSDKVSSYQNLDEREHAIKLASDELKTRLISLKVKNPEEIISKLVDASKAKEEASRLKVLLTQKDELLTTLAAIDKALQEVGSKNKGEDAKRLILETMMSYEQLKKLVIDPDDENEAQPTDVIKRIGALNATEQLLKTALGQDGSPTSEQISKIVKNAESYVQAEKFGLNPTTLQKTNSDLKGQVQFLQNKLNRGKGGDLPPCWANEAGKAEMFLTVYLKDDSVSFEPAWPSTRQADAEALPNYSALMSNTSRTYEDFLQATRPISDLANQRECKFYVRLASQIQGAVLSDRRRLMIETQFYKVELRR
ncbi:hypothetical protein [Pseudomonas sp. PS01297]|uniref:hypothetical protein n=1 Tax=Pseudomonas sp. PS01297 TaxID=2991433 RepID=UPI00249A0E25|nr:hypothetical protein [Pseudomonas sp. PS01297]